jgi:hypothetical protein
MAGGGDEASAARCAPMKATSEGLWQGDNPLHFSLPLIILQVCLVLVLTRGLALALRQPRVIAEIIVSCSHHPPCISLLLVFFFIKQSLYAFVSSTNYIGLLVLLLQ